MPSLPPGNTLGSETPICSRRSESNADLLVCLACFHEVSRVGGCRDDDSGYDNDNDTGGNWDSLQNENLWQRARERLRAAAANDTETVNRTGDNAATIDNIDDNKESVDPTEDSTDVPNTSGFSFLSFADGGLRIEIPSLLEAVGTPRSGVEFVEVIDRSTGGHPTISLRTQVREVESGTRHVRSG